LFGGNEALDVYVDASGDNGFKFDSGSTVCYCVAIFASKTVDNQYNKEILKEIKKVLHCRDKDEIKYSTLRRHCFACFNRRNHSFFYIFGP